MRHLSIIFYLFTICLSPICKAQSTALGVLKYSQITAFLDTTKQALIPVSMYFNKYESVTKAGILQKTGNENSKFVIPVPEEKRRFNVYVNNLQKEMRSCQRADSEMAIVKDSLEHIDWKILPATRKIGGMTCQAAQATVRGRVYNAWFTTEVPLGFGPWKLQGLPGLILEAKSTDNKVYFRFESLQMPPWVETKVEPLEPLSNMKVVNETEFLTLKKKNETNFQKMMESQPGYDRGQPVIITITGIEIYPESK